jgi:hypothetical protein
MDRKQALLRTLEDSETKRNKKELHFLEAIKRVVCIVHRYFYGD